MMLNLIWFEEVYRISIHIPSFEVLQVNLNAKGDGESSLMSTSRAYRYGKPGTGSKGRFIQRFQNCEANEFRLER
jgi:hypothetical protein